MKITMAVTAAPCRHMRIDGHLVREYSESGRVCGDMSREHGILQNRSRIGGNSGGKRHGNDTTTTSSSSRDSSMHSNSKHKRRCGRQNKCCRNELTRT